MLFWKSYIVSAYCRQYKTAIKYQNKLYMHMYFITHILRHK